MENLLQRLDFEQSNAARRGGKDRVAAMPVNNFQPCSARLENGIGIGVLPD